MSGGHFSDSPYSDPWWSMALAAGVNRLGSDYGDRMTSEASYDAVRRYTDYLTSTAKDEILNWGLGDWLPRAGSTKTKVEFTSTAAYYYGSSRCRVGDFRGQNSIGAPVYGVERSF